MLLNLDILSHQVRQFLSLHGIGWTEGKHGGTYASMQEVSFPLGGFAAYNMKWSDEARKRQRLTKLDGHEQWLHGETLDKFLLATCRVDSPSSLLVGNEDRIRCFLRLVGWPLQKELVAEADPAPLFDDFSHDRTKDCLALLCTYAGLHVLNEIPIPTPKGPTRTRRPDLCVWMSPKELWMIDVKTIITGAEVDDMVSRQYDVLLEKRHGIRPTMILVSPHETSERITEYAKKNGFNVMGVRELKEVLLGITRRLHTDCPKQYETVRRMFS